jgi:hypothetical protein
MRESIHICVIDATATPAARYHGSFPELLGHTSGFQNHVVTETPPIVS